MQKTRFLSVIRPYKVDSRELKLLLRPIFREINAVRNWHHGYFQVSTLRVWKPEDGSPQNKCLVQTQGLCQTIQKQITFVKFWRRSSKQFARTISITSFAPCFLSSQFLQYLCGTGTRRFVRSRCTYSVYPGKRPFGLSENIFEIHHHQAVLRLPCCHRRRLASPFRCWRAPFFNILHGELNLSRLRKTFASVVWFRDHRLKSPLLKIFAGKDFLRFWVSFVGSARRTCIQLNFCREKLWVELNIQDEISSQCLPALSKFSPCPRYANKFMYDGYVLIWILRKCECLSWLCGL